jgi:outer membrane protein assembly factor BamE (lipoprotein component of BamABCDE complex)
LTFDISPNPIAMKRNLLALIVTLAEAGCTSTSSYVEHTRSVQVGMTEQQLTEILGKPDVITKRTDGSQVWVYAFDPWFHGATASYVLKDGKVVSVAPSS